MSAPLLRGPLTSFLSETVIAPLKTLRASPRGTKMAPLRRTLVAPYGETGMAPLRMTSMALFRGTVTSEELPWLLLE